MLGGGGVIDQSISRTTIAGRVEHDVVPGYTDYYIEVRLMRQHCASLGIDFDDFKNQLSQKYRIAFVKKNLLAKTRGPDMRVQSLHISIPSAPEDEEA